MIVRCGLCRKHLSTAHVRFYDRWGSFFHEDCYRSAGRIVFWFLILVGVLLIVRPVEAQNARSQVFPLNTAFPDSTFYCRHAEAALEVANAAEEPYFETVVVKYLRTGECGNIMAVMTYKRLVYRARNGHRVYEVDVGGMKLHVPTSWRHEET